MLHLLQLSGNQLEITYRSFIYVTSLREGVDDGRVERVAQVSRPVVEGALSSSSGLNSESQGTNHSKTGVLDFSKLQDLLLLGVWGESQRVEVLPSWVQPPLRVELGIPLELNVSDEEDLNPNQSRNGEGQWKSKVSWPFDEFNLHNRGPQTVQLYRQFAWWDLSQDQGEQLRQVLIIKQL